MDTFIIYDSAEKKGGEKKIQKYFIQNKKTVQKIFPKYFLIMSKVLSLLVLLALTTISFNEKLLFVAGFQSIALPYSISSTFKYFSNSRIVLSSSSSSDSSSTSSSNTLYNVQELFPNDSDVIINEYILSPHRPLGCTVEESLANSQMVFISKIVDGGYADQAGIQVGDVLLGVTSLFGNDVSSVIGLGVEKVKGIVASCAKEDPLEIHIARGTSILEEHEKILIELCSNEDGISSDKEIEQCVIDYLAMDSVGLDDVNDDDDELCTLDEEGNCLVDDLYNMWAEDLPVSSSVQSTLPQQDDQIEQEKPTVKPWSSRSSPSGTYQRDPVTGKMIRID